MSIDAEAQKYYQTAYVEVSVFDDPNKGACVAARVSSTDYAAKYIQESYRFLTEEGKPTTSWWLRSPGRYQSDALTIAPSGVVQIDTHVNWNKTVVRPAMWVDLSVIDGLEQTEKLSGDSFKK